MVGGGGMGGRVELAQLIKFHEIIPDTFQSSGAELCESRGGRPGLPVPNSPCYGLCGRKAALNLIMTKSFPARINPRCEEARVVKATASSGSFCINTTSITDSFSCVFNRGINCVFLCRGRVSLCL